MSWLVLALLAAQGQAQECKPVSVDNNGKMRQAIFCRGTDGQWRERDSATQPEPLPADFQGVIVYEGEMDGIARLRPSNPNRQGQELPYGGLVRFRAEYDGNLVSAKGEPIKAVNVGPVTLTGTRSGSTCTLFEPNGARWQLRCDRSGLAGTVSGTRPDNRGEWRWQHSFETGAVSVKSNADAAREQAERVAERQKQEALAKEERRKVAVRELPVLWSIYSASDDPLTEKRKIFRDVSNKTREKVVVCREFPPLSEQFRIYDEAFEKIRSYRSEFPELFSVSNDDFKKLENIHNAEKEYVDFAAEICRGYY